MIYQVKYPSLTFSVFHQICWLKHCLLSFAMSPRPPIFHHISDSSNLQNCPHDTADIHQQEHFITIYIYISVLFQLMTDLSYRLQYFSMNRPWGIASQLHQFEQGRFLSYLYTYNNYCYTGSVLHITYTQTRGGSPVDHRPFPIQFQH